MLLDKGGKILKILKKGEEKLSLFADKIIYLGKLKRSV